MNIYKLFFALLSIDRRRFCCVNWNAIFSNQLNLRRAIEQKNNDSIFEIQTYSNNFVINIYFRFNETPAADHIGTDGCFSTGKTKEEKPQVFEHLLATAEEKSGGENEMKRLQNFSDWHLSYHACCSDSLDAPLQITIALYRFCARK